MVWYDGKLRMYQYSRVNKSEKASCDCLLVLESCEVSEHGNGSDVGDTAKVADIHGFLTLGVPVWVQSSGLVTKDH